MKKPYVKIIHMQKGKFDIELFNTPAELTVDESYSYLAEHNRPEYDRLVNEIQKTSRFYEHPKAEAEDPFPDRDWE